MARPHDQQRPQVGAAVGAARWLCVIEVGIYSLPARTRRMRWHNGKLSAAEQSLPAWWLLAARRALTQYAVTVADLVDLPRPAAGRNELILDQAVDKSSSGSERLSARRPSLDAIQLRAGEDGHTAPGSSCVQDALRLRPSMSPPDSNQKVLRFQVGDQGQEPASRMPLKSGTPGAGSSIARR